MHYAIVDIGSNTVRMCVYCVEQDGGYVQLHKESRTLELLSHVQNGVLDTAGEASLIGALTSFAEIATRLRIAERFAFATAVFRKITDVPALCARLSAATGWQIEVLSGDEEAACSFAGLISRHRHARSGVMIDMGGGSTEFLRFADRACIAAVSEPFGCVSLRRQFVANEIPTPAEAKAIAAYVADTIRPRNLPEGAELYLIGGTAKAMGVLYRQVYGDYALHPNRIRELIVRFGQPSKEDLAHMTALFPERVQSAVAGMLAYGAIFAELAPSRILISGAGVREGYLVRKVEKANRGLVCEKK